MIADKRLLRTRADLAFALEQNWARFGWQIQKAQTPADLRNAIKFVSGVECAAFRALRQEPVQEAKAEELRKLRRTIQDSRAEARKAFERMTDLERSVQQARLAVDQAANRPDVSQIQHLYDERVKKLAKAKDVLREQSDKLRAQQDSLDRQEGYFAQWELLNFLHCGRYSLNPLSLANAIAGLPIVSWRQSCNRCTGAAETISPGHTYKLFLVIKKLYAQAATNTEEALERMRAHLLNPKNSRQSNCIEFRKDWYYLKCAISAIYRRRYDPQSIPYRIFAEYQRRTGARGPLDLLLEEENRL